MINAKKCTLVLLGLVAACAVVTWVVIIIQELVRIVSTGALESLLLLIIALGIWFVGYWLRELYDLINHFDKPFLYSPDETDNVVWGTTAQKGKKK